jgi:hypothetical protein
MAKDDRPPGKVRVRETENATGAQRYVPNTVPDGHGGWSLDYTPGDAANEVAYRRRGPLAGRYTYEIVPATS